MVNARFEEAVARFDAENGNDPKREMADGHEIAGELLYARRLSQWVMRLDPGASEALQLAAHCQHIRRWEVPRSDFPADRSGYLRWRTHLKRFHAEIAEKILRDCGYDEEMITRVKELNLKTGFPENEESRTLEDALCLVFLEFQLKEFAARTERDKVINALRKSWGKMSDRGRKAALSLALGDDEQTLLTEAGVNP